MFRAAASKATATCSQCSHSIARSFSSASVPSIGASLLLLHAAPRRGGALAPETRVLAEAILSPDAADDPEQERKNRIRRRLALSRAITLVESRSPSHMEQADTLLNHLLKEGAKRGEGGRADGKKSPPPSFRVGIAGPPGAGKSSFIETFGLFVLNQQQQEGRRDVPAPRSQAQSSADAPGAPFHPSKLAVVCIDPSSTLTGGSILGDKTRMMELSRHDRAFVRPSPSRGTLGGVAAYTNDVICLCQAAGYDMVLVETVGLGQSEVEICEGVDMLILMVPPGGGDELQGVKKGIVELADMLVVNKADGNLLPAARTTAADYRGAMRFLRQRVEGWEVPPVLLVSARTGDGMQEVWDEICRFRDIMTSNGELIAKRHRQSRYWMWKYVRDLIAARAKSDPVLRNKAESMEEALDHGLITPRVAASELVESLTSDRSND